MAFAACEELSPEPKPEPGPGPEPEKEYAAELTLTSEAEMNFDAEGGEGVITYTAEMVEVTRTEPAVVEASCAATWVTDLTVAEDITFIVRANEAEARETKIVVTYWGEKFEVAVKQAAKTEEPESGVKFAATCLDGDYYGDEYSPGVGNYYIFLSDLGLSEDGEPYIGGTYYSVDLYGPLFEGEGDITLPVGTYTFDAEDTCAMWTIGNYYSGYAKINSSEDYETYTFTDATLVVTETDVTLTATINGEVHTVTFEGKGNIADFSSTNTEVEFEPNYAFGYYFGDMYTPGVADNFYFFISDLGMDEEGYALPNGQYFRFDLYTEIVDTTNGIELPDGTYEFDVNNTYAPGTFTDEYSMYYSMDEYGYDYAATALFSEGTLVKEGNKISVEVIIDGTTITFEFEGIIDIYDSRTPEEDPEDPEDPENPTPGESYSTLTGDLELNITNAFYALEYYGDYYSADTDNWVLYLYEDIETLDGAFIMLDFTNDPYADNIAGTYTVDDGDWTYEQYTYFPGYVDGDDMWGSWYTEMVAGVDLTAIAPLTNGEIKIECAGDIYTITFDCVDDAGHKITGSVVANPIDYSAMALSATNVSKKPAKKSSNKAVSMQKSKVEPMSKSTTEKRILTAR